MDKSLSTIFLVDDDADMRAATSMWLELSGYQVQSFADAVSALELLTEGFSGVVVSDVRMPKMDGMEFLARLNSIDADIPVVLVSAHGDVQMAVDAMRKGAYDFIEKPFEPERLLDVVQRAGEKRRLIQENRELRKKLAGPIGIEQRMLGNSPAIRQLRDELLDVADTDAPVLIRGETGTGKEVAARCLHEFGARSEGKYVAVNCGAVPENMFESELFGHERGAFTGADKRRIGRFEYAHGGLLFLDEIVSMPMAMQVKVLRVLQEREVIRIGSNETQDLDVRLVCATNKDLLSECDAGNFRNDLYYRINVVELVMPPLREREDDVVLLFEHFAHQAAATYDRPEVTLNSSDIGLLMNHPWPGNVRELKNIAERYILSSQPQGKRLASALQQIQNDQRLTTETPLPDLLQNYEKMLLEQALKRHSGEVQAMMDSLGLPRRTLSEKLAKYRLNRKDYL
jgi:two-component system, NtrC family, C4-dicarboxylate transport response regulator DctD